MILLLEWAAYSKLWHETAAVEKIKRSVDDILREETGMAQRTRKHKHDLSWPHNRDEQADRLLVVAWLK